MEAILEGVIPAYGMSAVRTEWLAGRYDSALVFLAALPAHADRELFRARILGRLGRHNEALDAIRDGRASGLFTDAWSTAMAHSFDAVSYAALGDNAPAQDALELAGPYHAWGLTQKSVELAYNIAMTTWMLGDAARTETIARDHLAGERSRIDSLFTARFWSLRGWLFAAREQYAAQAACLTSAIELLLAAPETDVGVLAWLVHALAALIRDINMPRAIALITDLEKRVEWTENLRNARFETVRATAWSLALQGEYIAAFRKLDLAKGLAQTSVQCMLSRLDQSLVAHISQQDIIAAAQLADAEEIIAAHDWSTGAFEEAASLVYAAELLAPSNTARANHLLVVSASLRQVMAKNAGFAHDRRLDAMTDFAEAIVREAQGDRRVAKHRAERAFHVFVACNYEWRAARCALLLHVITADQRWLDEARKLSDPYPRSFIRHDVERYTAGSNPWDRLSVRQRDVLQMLRSGKSTDEIAAALGISPNTVRIHLNRIYGAFGVKNRTALLAEAARLLAA